MKTVTEPIPDVAAAEIADPAEQPAQAAAETDWKAEARKWEKQAKSNLAQLQELKPKADQFAALEEASKSEAQRLAEATEAARRDAESARADATRYKVAATHNIGADHFDLLGSGTEEEITARAEKISALLAAQAAAAAATGTTPPPVTRPTEQLRPGATPNGSGSEDDAIWGALGLDSLRKQ